MDWDLGAITAGFVVSSIGFVLFRYGKRVSRPPHLLVGLCMMAYPFFVPGALLISSIGVGLLLLLWAATKLGH